MPTDVYLYETIPLPDRERQAVGRLTIGDISYTGQTVDGGSPCLTVDVQSLPLANQSPTRKFSWLLLNVSVWTNRAPRRQVGQVFTGLEGMWLSLGDSVSVGRQWLWQLLPEDVELVERTHCGQGTTAINFQIKVSGIVKADHPDSATLSTDDIVALRANPVSLAIPTSQWHELLRSLGYDLPPSLADLAGRSSLDHPSWSKATDDLEKARSQHRLGEDAAALNVCLSSLEALVSFPYQAKSWEKLLDQLPGQKSDGIAALFSGLATYCNKVGHHRSREQRDAEDKLIPMPLDHWEADLVLGAAQFLLAYALRLQMSADATAELQLGTD